MTKKKLKATTLLMLMLCPVVGCGKEKVTETDVLEQTIAKQKEQIAQLESDIKNMQITENKVETSLREVEGSKVPTFETIEGKIVFPIKLEMPNATEAANVSNVLVGTKYRFSPSNNWLLRLKGATLEVNHPSKVWGNIKAVSIKETVSKEILHKLLQGFFKGFPATTITYREVYIDSKNAGMIAKAPIKVDDKPYVVNVGIIQKGEYGLLLLFAHEEDGTGVQQELIDLLLGSGKYGEYAITLE